MNSSLNTEHSIFDKAAVLNSHMIKKQILSPTYIEDSLANLEILKNQDQINAFIKNLGKKKFIKVFVILGNPDKKILSDTKNFASTKEINFEMLVKSL